MEVPHPDQSGAFAKPMDLCCFALERGVVILSVFIVLLMLAQLKCEILMYV